MVSDFGCIVILGATGARVLSATAPLLVVHLVTFPFDTDDGYVPVSGACTFDSE